MLTITFYSHRTSVYLKVSFTYRFFFNISSTTYKKRDVKTFLLFILNGGFTMIMNPIFLLLIKVMEQNNRNVFEITFVSKENQKHRNQYTVKRHIIIPKNYKTKPIEIQRPILRQLIKIKKQIVNISVHQ